MVICKIADMWLQGASYIWFIDGADVDLDPACVDENCDIDLPES